MSNTAELAENKLSILYFIDALEMPLTNHLITHFFLEKYLIEYIDLQQLLYELVETDHLCYIKGSNCQYYSLTDKGKEALNLFINKININTIDTINKYVAENRERIKKESQLKAEYSRIDSNEYMVTLQAIEGEVPLVEIKLNVVSKQQAKTICNNWRLRAPQIYKKIMETLAN